MSRVAPRSLTLFDKGTETLATQMLKIIGMDFVLLTLVLSGLSIKPLWHNQTWSRDRRSSSLCCLHVTAGRDHRKPLCGRWERYEEKDRTIPEINMSKAVSVE